MPYDVCMCEGGRCPLKENCLRYTGRISARQDFFGMPPYNISTGTCEHFWSDRPHPEQVARLAYQIWESENYPENRSIEFWLRAERLLINSIREN
jgi:hypothetical protein